MRKRQKQQAFLLVVLLGLGAFVAWALWPTAAAPDEGRRESTAARMDDGMGTQGGGTVIARQPTLVEVNGQAEEGRPVIPDPFPDKSGPIDPETDFELLKPDVAMTRQQADAIFDQAVSVLSAAKVEPQQMLAVRTNLSAAYFSQQLDPGRQDRARQMLTKLAEATLLSSVALEGDPYTFYYYFQKGDVLTKVERDKELRVPTQFIEIANAGLNPRNIPIGHRLKLLRGPFHALVYKDKFVMDIYLKNYDAPLTFVKRLQIGIGKDNATPLGAFQVQLGKKLERAPWNPPPGSEFKQTILWNQPNYPLGSAGYWISLRGVEPSNQSATGYGIHGTNQPESIGKAESLGCIRMLDADIEFVFSVLYEKWSSVHIR